MARSQIKHDGPVMGRADVLLRFLRLIGKDRPKDLDPFLKEIDGDTDQRPLVDQLVDRIIAGDTALYDQYARARRESGSRNPYSSPEETQGADSHAQSLGTFISLWTQIESIGRKLVEAQATEERSGHRNQYQNAMQSVMNVLPATMQQELYYVQRLRNLWVHGIEKPTLQDLTQAIAFLTNLLAQLTIHTHATVTVSKRSQKKPKS